MSKQSFALIWAFNKETSPARVRGAGHNDRSRSGREGCDLADFLILSRKSLAGNTRTSFRWYGFAASRVQPCRPVVQFPE